VDKLPFQPSGLYELGGLAYAKRQRDLTEALPKLEAWTPPPVKEMLPHDSGHQLQPSAE